MERAPALLELSCLVVQPVPQVMSPAAAVLTGGKHSSHLKSRTVSERPGAYLYPFFDVVYHV